MQQDSVTVLPSDTVLDAYMLFFKNKTTC